MTRLAVACVVLAAGCRDAASRFWDSTGCRGRDGRTAGLPLARSGVCYPREMGGHAKVGLATQEDLLALQEHERRHELIEGSIVEKGAATGEHGTAQRKLSAYVDPYDQRPGGRRPGGWWFATEVDVLFDPLNVLRPDVWAGVGSACPSGLEGFPSRLRRTGSARFSRRIGETIRSR